MARYIDADKFMERPKASPAFSNMGMDGYFLLDVVEELLKKFPTADVVPKSEVDRLELTLQGVMWSVDKWLDEADYNADPVKRAITMREKTLQIVENVKSEVAREFIEIINDRIDNIRARIPYGGRAQGKTLAVEKMRLLESLKAEIAKKYKEVEG